MLEKYINVGYWAALNAARLGQAKCLQWIIDYEGHIISFDDYSMEWNSRMR